MSIGFERHLKEILSLSVREVDKAYSYFEYFDDDESFILEEVVTEYLNLTIYIDLEFRNNGICVLNTYIADQEDRKHKTFTDHLYTDLERYYNKESISLAINYSQSIEIAHDQKDPYNLRPAMSLSHENIVKYRQIINDIINSKFTEQELINLFEHGSVGRRLHTSASFQYIVDNMIDIIDADVFPTIGKKYRPYQKAQFLDSLFLKKGVDTIKSYQRCISNNYLARA